MTLGELLLHHLREKGIIQAELARRADVPASSLNEWIKGTSFPRYENLERIALALDMDLGRFYAPMLKAKAAADTKAAAAE